jgi:hypothetical protein
MKLQRYFAIFCLFFLSQVAIAACEDVIKLSKTVESRIEKREDFESSAAAYCNEYKNNSSTSKSANYGISYKFIAASMGNSNASESEVASRICSSNLNESFRKNAYDNYIEKISDKAYDAYKSCLELSSANLGFSVNSVIPKEILFSARNGTGVSTPAKMQVDSTIGVECRWLNSQGGLTFELPAGASALMKCTRNTTSSESSITIIDTSMVGRNSITVPWAALDSNGIPINTLNSLSQKVDNAIAALNDTSSSIRSAVVPFSLESCPSGWEEYKPAYGKFIRGIDNSGSTIDPDGKRSHGSLQADMVGPHVHDATLKLGAEPLNGGARHVIAAGAHGANSPTWPAPGLARANSGIESRPKNVALLYCSRK